MSQIPRVIPCLLLRRGGLVKTIGFEDPKYVGDPINAVRIFNEKEVDELVLLDIERSKTGGDPDYEAIREIVSEAFMPIAYGGGVRSVEQADRLIALGIEKIVVNTSALSSLDIVRGLSKRFGASSVVLAVDVKRDWLGRYKVYGAARGKTIDTPLLDHLKAAADAGAGEIFLNDVARDGTGKGYDLDLVRQVAHAVDVPVIACGGAGTLQHFRDAVGAGASAVSAGSMFVYMGRHRAVMINYPSPRELKETFASA